MLNSRVPSARVQKPTLQLVGGKYMLNPGESEPPPFLKAADELEAFPALELSLARDSES